MKRIMLTVYILFLTGGFLTTLQAQPSQQLVSVMVSPDHADWKYTLKEEAVFNVHIYKNDCLLQGVTIDYELGPECFPDVKKKGVILKDGKLVLKASMKEAGFLRCKVVARIDGKSYEGLATVAYAEDRIMPMTKEPADFDTFWANAIEEARKTPLQPELRLLPDKCTPTLNVYEASFQNDRANSRIYGLLYIPKKEGKYPAVLQVPGAGFRPRDGVNFGDEVIAFEIDIHGVPATYPKEFYTRLGAGPLKGYASVNKNDRDNHYYKRVYVGCVRAVDFIFSLPEFNGKTVGVTGGSQGGALSIVTAALDPRIKFVSALYPALCDFSGYLHNRAGGWPHYYRNAKPLPGEVEALSYYDVVNFARRIRVPGWYSWGFNDATCPPTSTFAAYNVITAPKELHLFPKTGHWTYPEQQALRHTWLREQYEK